MKRKLTAGGLPPSRFERLPYYKVNLVFVTIMLLVFSSARAQSDYGKIKSDLCNSSGRFLMQNPIKKQIRQIWRYLA